MRAAALLLALFAAVAARWPEGTDLERALQDLTSKDNLQRLRELSEQDGTAEAYRNERRKYWHLEEVARDKARNARRDMTKWEADWLLGATASQVGVEAVVALGVKDADVREKLAWYEQQIELHRSKTAPTTAPPATGKAELR